MSAPVDERPLAEQLARQILDERFEHGWLAPLAREYLKEIADDAARGEAQAASPGGGR
jgi:hypothetical protein